MNFKRSGIALCMLDGFIYASGGVHKGNACQIVERYKPSSDSGWTTIQSMKKVRYNHNLVALSEYDFIA